ncbi:MAG: histidinol dehydrogenase [Candidatus Promineifilaceae bacterium]|nr:histidinol dehydrogenase [Candidatus Promineifilaceae bacterium]
MIRLVELDQARQTILLRSRSGRLSFPEGLTADVELLFGPGATPESAVSQILDSVRREGDSALHHWTRVLDRTELEDFAVPQKVLDVAAEALAPELANALDLAIERIRDFHERQPLPDWQTDALGGTVGQRVTAIERVGVYVPGGSAPLPSSLLMSVIPAQVAGVAEIALCTPPQPDPVILAAAKRCGVSELYQVGGAQAVAAMAFGTESIRPVDKIVGAGNLFVTLAKQQVYGIVGLDGLAGPTETMVIADGEADPAWVAADLLAQAEHNVLASAILLTTSRPLAEAVQRAVAIQLEDLSRTEIIVQSLAHRGGIVVVPDLETAAALANAYAPEHLCLAVRQPAELLPRLAHAGGIFMDEHSFEVLGDYVAGPSHIMPTGGSARFASPLNVLDFVKITSIIGLDPATSSALSETAALLAEAERLTAHAAAAQARREASVE